MQRLLEDVLQQRSSYKAILVYDVSRWGRFQDVDEAAHYEFLCKNSGVPVYYCDEPYLNGGSTSAIFKNMRRSQAGEFSRELSEKTFRASKHIAGLGFRLGGVPGLGLRRMMVSETGKSLQQMASGEFKYNKTCRTILVPGPAEEIELVQEIFSMAATGRLTCGDIAKNLNHRGIPFHTGKAWDYYDVERMLQNPKYIGRNVWGRTSVKLKRPVRQIMPEEWTVKEAAFVSLVDAKIFSQVQSYLRSRSPVPWSNHALLSKLKALLKRKGKLSQRIIDNAPGMPSSATYYQHFGRLKQLYPLLGYRPAKGTFTKICRRDQNERLRIQLFSQICALFPLDMSVFRLPNRRRSILRLDNGLSVSVVLCRSLRLPKREIAWKIYPTRAERDYMTLLCRLNSRNDGFLDFHLFPFIEKRSWYLFTSDDLWFKKGKLLGDLANLCREAKAFSRLDEASFNIWPTSEHTRALDSKGSLGMRRGNSPQA
jgi:DNA invertase Pin-like site-specific DNA recombinase